MCRGCSPDTSKMTRRTRAPQITSREEQEASVCGVRREKQETREAQERDTRERHKRERRERRETQETRKTRSTGRDLLVHGLQAFRMLIDLKLHRSLSLCRCRGCKGAATASSVTLPLIRNFQDYPETQISRCLST